MRVRREISWSFVAIVLGLTLGLLTAPQPPVEADLPLIGDLGNVVKLFGIGYVVSEFGPSIDKTINKLLAQHDAAIEGETKVVPILRVGRGDAAVGAAQVMGPPEQVRKVQAVAEMELGISKLRGRALIPVTTKKRLTSSIKGVGGVGVSATMKVKL